MAYKYDLLNSELLLKESFASKSHLEYINKYVQSLLDTEDFSMFGKYTKSLVIAYFKAFLNRLVSQIWSYLSNNQTNPEKFFYHMVLPMSRQLTRAKNSLLEKKNLSNVMSEHMVCITLDKFFQEYEDRAEFNKAQADYIDLKQDFSSVKELTNALYSCGNEMVENAEYLLGTYLKYKVAILKGMGYDVVLEYYSVDNFNLIYRDARLNDATLRANVEQIAMNAALSATMPGYAVDIELFSNLVTEFKA